MKFLKLKPSYLIWGTIFEKRKLPLKGIKAEILFNKKKTIIFTDRHGNIRIPVSKEGKYKVRVSLPKATSLDFSKILNSNYRTEQEKIRI